MLFFSKVKALMASRLPNLQQTAAVYSIIVLFVYGWMIYWYLWKLPSWLFYLSLTDLLTYFAYAMTVNFFESVFVLLFPLVLCLLLPPGWLRDQFAVRGTTMVAVLLIFLTYYSRLITGLVDLPSNLHIMLLEVVFGMVMVAFIAGKVRLIRKVIEEISNRAIIFLYLSIPISAVSMLVVLIRNLFV